MKKIFVCSISCIIIVASLLPEIAFAESGTIAASNDALIEQSKSVDSIEDFKNLMEEGEGEHVTLAEKHEILANVGSTIVSEYENQKMAEAAAIVNSNKIGQKIISVEPNGDSSLSAVVDIGDGASLSIEYHDVEEPSIVDVLESKLMPIFIDSAYADTMDSIQAIDIYQYYEGYKDYGNRYYTATYRLIYLIGHMTIITENHYNISSAGLKERTGKTMHDFWGYFADVRDSWAITDATANKVGYDINILGTVTYDRTSEVFPPLGPVYLQQDTRVKLLALDKINSRAKISQYAYILRSHSDI